MLSNTNLQNKSDIYFGRKRAGKDEGEEEMKRLM